MSDRTALVVGASRTIGLALTEHLTQRGWHVVATVRHDPPEPLTALAARIGHIDIESLDITSEDQIRALHARLDTRALDLLFVNAGITDAGDPAADVHADVFADVMITNALSPLRVIEDLDALVPPTGTIAVMSSRQGRLTMNTYGGRDVYRASKAALNQLMLSYAARHRDDPRTILLLHPGWVQIELGGPGATLTPDESARALVDVVENHIGEGGLQFLDHTDLPVPW